MIKTFAEHRPWAGPLAWMLSVQYFVIQMVVAADWSTHYSLSSNTISDLGNTACGLYGSRLVCSPLHDLMNASLILLGITMFAGAVLIYQMFRGSFGAAAGFGCMALAGAGTVLVGLFPENTVSSLHIIGSAMPFFVGNIGMVVLSLILAMPKPLRYYTFISGVVALIALACLLTNHYLGLGLGGIERLTAYPQTIWLIIFGAYLVSEPKLSR